MKTKEYVLLALGLSCLLMLTGCPNSKTVVKKISGPTTTPIPGKPVKQEKLNGVFYSLPRTVVRATVPIKKTESVRGRYYEYAQLFFPDEKIQLANETKFELDKPVLDSYSEADPNEVYYVDIRAKWYQTKSMFLELSEAGVFSQAKAKVEDQTPAIVGAIAKTAATVIGIPLSTRAAMSFDTAGTRTFKKPGIGTTTVPATGCETFFNPDEKYLCELLDTSEQMFYADLRTAQDRAFFRSLDRRPTKKWSCFYKNLVAPITPDEMKVCFNDPNSLEWSQAYVFMKLYPDIKFRRALVAYYDYQSMAESRDRYLMSTNESGLDGAALEGILREIDGRIKAYKNEYFVGSAKTGADQIGPFKVIPQPGVNEHELFTFSKSTGIVSIANEFTNSVSFPKVTIPNGFASTDVARKDLATVQMTFQDNVRPNETPLAVQVGNQRYDESGERGFRYRVPSELIVAVSTTEGKKSEELVEAPVLIAQRGITVSLPASGGSWMTSYELALHPNTGALKNFTLGSDALVQKSMIEDAEKAITTLTTADSELTRLDRQQKILDLKKKIKELQAALETDGSTP
jgi:hypothetical protein